MNSRLLKRDFAHRPRWSGQYILRLGFGTYGVRHRHRHCCSCCRIVDYERQIGPPPQSFVEEINFSEVSGRAADLWTLRTDTTGSTTTTAAGQLLSVVAKKNEDNSACI